MRISDWSSDVCSSDLAAVHLHADHDARGTDRAGGSGHGDLLYRGGGRSGGLVELSAVPDHAGGAGRPGCGRNPAAFPAVESQSCGSGASGSCRPTPDASGEEAAARHREQIAGKDTRMSDTTLASAAFDARLHDMTLHALASHALDRTWKSRLQQLEISHRLASPHTPPLEASAPFST